MGVGPACRMCGQVDTLPVGVKLSSFGKRFGGNLLEGVLVLVTLGIGYLIWSLIVWKDGTTPSKQILGMRVIWTADRRPASWGRMALREVVGKGLIVGAIGAMSLGIGSVVAICLIFGALHQALWDLVASTLVVDDIKAEVTT